MVPPRVGTLRAVSRRSLAADRVSAALARARARARYTLYVDMCFDWDAKQVDIYNRTARDIVDACLEGYNGAPNLCPHATHS